MIQDTVIVAIKKYKQHASIVKIKKLIRIENYLNFKHIDDKKNCRAIKNLKQNRLNKNTMFLSNYSRKTLICFVSNV